MGRLQISGGNFISSQVINNQVPTNGEKAFFGNLVTNVATTALHDSGGVSDPPKCHPGTRIDLLDVLITWALFTIYEFPIRWLNGPAGAGKSAIMRTLAEMLAEKGLLLASFFFFRPDPTRNTAQCLISTIAYQMWLGIPPLQPWVESAIESNPLIFKASLSVQIQALIIDPLLHYFYDPNSIIITPFPRIILIDGLDECQGSEIQKTILHALSNMVQLPIPVAIVFASRPEYQIRSAFELGTLNALSSRITLDDSFEPDNDIRRYYLVEFKGILSTHPLQAYLDTSWPQEEVIEILVRNASGLFIYAATVMKFVKSARHNPVERLQIILGHDNRGIPKSFQKLDYLYTTVFLNVAPETLPDTLRVLGLILTPPPNLNAEPRHRSPEFIELLLGGFPSGYVQSRLLDLESLLTVRDAWESICVFHSSLVDFLFDRLRSGDFFIDTGLVYADIASLCLKISNGQPSAVNYDTPHPLLKSYCEAQLQVSLQNATPTEVVRQRVKEKPLPYVDVADANILSALPSDQGNSKPQTNIAGNGEDLLDLCTTGNLPRYKKSCPPTNGTSNCTPNPVPVDLKREEPGKPAPAQVYVDQTDPDEVRTGALCPSCFNEKCCVIA